VVLYDRSDEEITQSKELGYSPISSRLISKKISNGMVYLEIGKNIVLESELIRIEKYDKILHHQWKNVSSSENKNWKYVVNHGKSNIITIDDYVIKYGKIPKSKSVVEYINLKK